jgi:BirA family biotin operon repressor/biotin-[acetyl-CoA-carboxylase] ligase
MTYRLIRLESCTSTNDVARVLARDGAPEGTIIVSAEQTAGRGTKGRSWFSVGGKGLYLTVILRPPAANLTRLPLMAGLAARDAVERSHGLSPKLFWPNDLVWNGKKLAGVLCENAFTGEALDYALVGVGINVNHEESGFPDEIRGLAISLRMATGKAADPESLLRSFRWTLEEWYGAFIDEGSARIVPAFERQSAFSRGEWITAETGKGLLRGTYHGLGPGGELLLACPDGIRRLTSAEVLRVLNS